MRSTCYIISSGPGMLYIAEVIEKIIFRFKIIIAYAAGKARKYFNDLRNIRTETILIFLNANVLVNGYIK